MVIVDFKTLQTYHFHSMFQLIDLEDGTIFSDHAEIHVLELTKIGIRRLQDTDTLEKWLKETLFMKSSTMKEAFKEIQRLSQVPKTRAIAIP
ncbi:Rpn family recombination-promoting nuclease/putative transposase [Sporosarcina sp. ANT_H38]|uniref:Rpn family recombination-promoting nuclease/putative transposase n=1 Tax=Sporosarcina sp. ANT_H38 TaxID=2597358 RepID=UPI0021079878|nr:Rpn family recombination-promoting nuclease/putative transposase [Sporosarcina sp. ANT_H38]